MGLTGLQQLANALDAFDTNAVIENIISDNSDALVELLKQQLGAGTDANKQPITFLGNTLYKAATIKYKQKHGVGLGAETEHITLYMSGNLYQDLSASLYNKAYSFKSSVPYFEDVIMKTGDTVTGLSEDSRKQFYNNILLPAFRAEWEKQTGVKLST